MNRGAVIEGIEVIQKFNHALSDEFCNDLIDHYKRSSSDIYQEKKFSPYTLKIDQGAGETWEHLKNLGELYLKMYLSQFPIGDIKEFCFSQCVIQHYTDECRLNLHTDGEHFPMDNYHNHLLGTTRTIGLLAFLNDEFENGILHFPLQKEEYKPVKGDMLVFPWGFLFPHYVTVPSQDRYSIRFDFWKIGMH